MRYETVVRGNVLSLTPCLPARHSTLVLGMMMEKELRYKKALQRRSVVPTKHRLAQGLVLITGFVLWIYITILSRRTSQQIYEHGDEKRRKQNAFFTHFWAHHISTHPVRPFDRTGFAEMGMRTQMYARLLENGAKGADLDYVEKVLWPFLPGIKQLRMSFLEGQRAQNGKGIVLSAGSNGFTFLVQFITIVREVFHCNIPIEVYYFGERDLRADLRAYVETNFKSVRTIDLKQLRLIDEEAALLDRQGFALKPFALIATNFTEVILADVDAIFLTSPLDLFDVKGYKETGTLFFHDRDHVRAGASQIVHQFLQEQLGSDGPSDRLANSYFWRKKGIYEQESGIVVFDKSRIETFAALLFTAWQNAGKVRDLDTYRIFWGDKETFWLAFELARFPYYFVQHYAGALGVEEAKHETGFCSEHPLHFIDPDHGVHDVHSVPRTSKRTKKIGKPAWFNGSLLDVKTRDSNRYLQATAWAMKGEWEFLPASESWCIRNYTKGDMDDYGLGTRLELLTSTGMRAELSASKFLASST